MRVALLAAVAASAVTPAFTVDVHPAPSGGVDLARVVRAAATRALAQLPHHGQISIDVLPNRQELIRRVGVGGLTDAKGNVELTWDSTRLDIGPHVPQVPCDHSLTKAQERAYWRLVRPALGRPDRTNLFAGANGAFPFWAGYSLGYDILGRYLPAHGLTGGQAVRVPTKTILAACRRGL
jgi:hypothetical protein